MKTADEGTPPLTAKEQHLMDLYDSLGVKWGHDPFPIIAAMRAALPSVPSATTPDSQRLDALEKAAREPSGILLHAEVVPTGRCGLGLQKRSLREAVNQAFGPFAALSRPTGDTNG